MITGDYRWVWISLPVFLCHKMDHCCCNGAWLQKYIDAVPRVTLLSVNDSTIHTTDSAGQIYGRMYQQQLAFVLAMPPIIMRPLWHITKGQRGRYMTGHYGHLSVCCYCYIIWILHLDIEHSNYIWVSITWAWRILDLFRITDAG